MKLPGFTAASSSYSFPLSCYASIVSPMGYGTQGVRPAIDRTECIALCTLAAGTAFAACGLETLGLCEIAVAAGFASCVAGCPSDPDGGGGGGIPRVPGGEQGANGKAPPSAPLPG